MADLMTLSQFGQTIKAKHPEYADIADDDLANKVLAKYPQYRDMVTPTLDFSNSQGQGTYQMTDKSGQTVGVPYGQVQNASGQGYQFASDQDRFRFAKDAGADPNRRGGMPLVMMSRGQSASDPSLNPGYMQAYSGAMKGGATMERPVIDAVGKATGLKQADIDESLKANTPMESAGKMGAIAAGVIPAVVAAPIATAGAVVGGTLGSTAGKYIGQKTNMTPENTALLSDALGLAGGTAGAVGAKVAAPAIASKISHSVLKASGAQLLKSAARDANQIPVSLDNTQEGALNLMEWQKTTNLGPTVNKFLQRITKPNAPPLTYKEARRFYQILGSLSADENLKMADPVKRDLTQMVVGLKQDIGNAADSVGQAANYYQGLGDYAKGKRLEGWYTFAKNALAKEAIKGVAKGAGIGAGGALGYEIYKQTQ